MHFATLVRNTRWFTGSMITVMMFSACHSDDVAGAIPFDECTGQPGCQTQAAPVAANVIPALDDATTRAAGVLNSGMRTSITSPIARLQTALVERDIVRGRIALTAVLDAITAAERTDPGARADLGVIRLGLAPAARSLGLPFSVIEAPSN